MDKVSHLLLTRAQKLADERSSISWDKSFLKKLAIMEIQQEGPGHVGSSSRPNQLAMNLPTSNLCPKVTKRPRKGLALPLSPDTTDLVKLS